MSEYVYVLTGKGRYEEGSFTDTIAVFGNRKLAEETLLLHKEATDNLRKHLDDKYGRGEIARWESLGHHMGEDNWENPRMDAEDMLLINAHPDKNIPSYYCNGVNYEIKKTPFIRGK